MAADHLHISHNDLDGVGCGILVKAALTSVDTVYVSYDNIETTLEELAPGYSSIIITDLAPSRPAIERLVAETELLLIDHHKSSEDLKKYPFVVHSIDKCATSLTYDKLSSMGHDIKRYENFADCVNDFDLWLLKRDDSLRLNMLLTLYGMGRFEKRFLSEPYTSFKPEEAMLVELEEERRRVYIENSAKNIIEFTDNQNRKAAVLFAESYTSELGNYILVNTNLDYVLIIHAQRKRASLRSRKDVDISGIAVSNGGGGHKNAAGFSIDNDFNVQNILKDVGII